MKEDTARDKAIDRLFGDKLRAQLHGRGPACPDVETLAAYVDRSLTPAERQPFEAHLLGCSHCQEHVAALVRLEESEQLMKGATVAPAPKKTAWFRWALAAPALAALVVVGLWYTGEFRHLLRQQEPVAVEPPAPPEPSTVSSESREAAKTVPLLAREELAEAEPAKAEAARVPSTQKPGAPKMSVYGSSGSSIDIAPKEAVGVGGRSGEEGDTAAMATPSQRARLVGPGPPAAAAAETKRKAETESAPRDEESARKEFARTDTLADKAASRGAQPGLASARPEAAEPSIEFHGFIENRRAWRVGKDGLIQKAGPNGTWETRASGVRADLFDISFATPRVGWAVGQAGTVLHTSDGGATWTKRPSPTTEDLVRVGAISESKLLVMTRSGKTLTSPDGGKTWKSSPGD